MASVLRESNMYMVDLWNGIDRVSDFCSYCKVKSNFFGFIKKQEIYPKFEI